MAHEITKTDKMVYFGQKPWHNLGIEMPNLMTASEAYTTAFGWYVKSEPIYIKVGDQFVEADKSYRANVRSDTNDVLGVVSDQYQIVQPIEAFSFFDEVTMDPNGPKYVTAGSLKGGKKMWLLAKMPNFINICDEDKYEEYILLYNSFDGSTGVQMLWTPIRVVCNNTLTWALNRAGDANIYKAKHFLNSVQVTKAQDFLGILRNNQQELKELSLQLLNTPCSTDRAIEFYSQLFPDAAIAKMPNQKSTGPVLKIMDLWENPNDFKSMYGTAYYALNQLTDFIDHHGSFRNQESRMENIMYGAKAELKQKAMDLAIEMFVGAN